MSHNGTIIENLAESPDMSGPDIPELIDRMTGLHNDFSLEIEILRGPSDKYLLVLDVGGLRKVNAIYGRKNGDILLKLIRDYILGMDIPDNTLYRMSTGDFGLLFKETLMGAGIAREIAQKLLERFDNEWMIPIGDWHQPVIVPANICIVQADVIKNLSAAGMYGVIEYTLDTARNTGGLAVYGDNIREGYQYKTALELGLKKAMHQNMAGFNLAFQPIIESGVAIWSGMEALCRWDSPDFGMVSPSEFIPIAEACGLISRIGLWLLEESILQVKRWGLDQIEGFLLDVNLSPFQLKIPDLDKTIIGLLERHGYPPEKLCLEVTESGSLNFREHDMKAVKRLSDIGVVIALDDFGSGFASLSVLHKLPVQLLKTDKSFLDGMESDKQLRHLFHAIIDLAHNSNMKVVAEGVETEAQARFLLEQGADYFQGYLFSRPLSAEQMAEKLHNFSTPSETLVSMEYDRTDLLKPNASQRYELSASMYKTLYKCVQQLFLNPDSDASIDLALQHIGRSLDVSRAYVFLKDTDGVYSNTHEWCAEGIEPQKENLQLVPIDESLSPWIRALKIDGILLVTDVRQMSQDVFEEMERQGIKSVAEFPVWRGKELYGFVGLDDCDKYRRWTPDEVQALHILTGLIASTLSKMWMQKELDSQSARRNTVLNSLDTAIHVTDIETNEILFANDSLIRMYGNQQLEGRKCWEVLENRRGKCDYCPIGDRPPEPGKIHQWDHYCEAVDRHLRVRGCVIPWTEGKLAHLEYADDITELKAYQNQLKVMATTDTLTRVLTRQPFIEAAERVLSAAKAGNIPATLAFIDLDNLKTINDDYGHAEGDECIISVVMALRQNIRGSDIIGRFGGDEFIILFSNCKRADAEKSVHRALKSLEAISLERGRDYSFSYGFVENTEIPRTKPDVDVGKLIDLADKRMLAHKKDKKKQEQG